MGKKEDTVVGTHSSSDYETGQVENLSSDAAQLAALGHKEELGKFLALCYRSLIR